MRADARRNREQIIVAARALFLEKGIHPPMEEIAQRAGVGVGTLYRRFPDRGELIHAVAADTLQRLAETARAARDQEPDAWSALSRFLHGCREYQLGWLQSLLDAPLHDAIRADPQLQQTRQILAGLVQQMTDRARAEGTLRADVTPADIATLMSLQAPPHRQVPARIMQVILDGLHTSAHPS
jgi:AcrR family transcriptional regulator